MLPGEKLRVAALNVRALLAVGEDLYIFGVVGHGVAAGSIVGVERAIAGEIEEQAWLGRVRIGRQNRCGRRRRVLERDLR